MNVLGGLWVSRNDISVSNIIIVIMYIYHVLINALRAHMIHINLNAIFYTHVEHSPTETIYTKHYMEKHTHMHTHACMRALSRHRDLFT